MPIISSHEDLPRATRGNAPSQEPILVERIAQQWWEDYQASDDFTRERAIPELPLRASEISKRCDRALWYSLTNTPESNPNDAASSFRMMLGSMIHSAAEAALAKLVDHGTIDEQGRKQGWFAEEDVDLRPAGFPGSAHADLIFYIDGKAEIVGETKSQGGFAFKMCTTNFKGAAEGPRWDHIMQGAMIAVAKDAPKILVMYFAMESISPDLAKKMGANEFGRFTAEWIFDTDDWREAVAVEAARQRRILALATSEPPLRPERSLSDVEIPGGAVVFDPAANGKWKVISPTTGNVTNSGTTWMCGYCNYRDRCIEDGPESSFVQLVEKGL